MMHDAFNDSGYSLIRIFFPIAFSAVFIAYVPFVFDYTLPLHLIILSVLSALAYGNFASKRRKVALFKTVIGALLLTTTASKISLMDATGANLLVNFYELSIITFLVMIYGLKRIWWIPLLTLSVNFLRLLYIHLYPKGDHWAVISNTFLSTFLEANISLWVILGISVFMIRKLGSTQRQLTEKNSALVASQKSLKRQRVLLEKKEEAFLKLSEQNSHELRHPLSRLMAALSLVDSEESKEALPESYKAEFFRMVARTSVEEMKAKLSEIRKK